MARPRLSSFTIIGILLLLIGIYGRIRGASFSFDPGMPAEPGEAYYYMLVGVLMIVNGFFWMKPLLAPAAENGDNGKTEEAQAGSAAAPASPAAKRGD